jgi:hypothetical protein
VHDRRHPRAAFSLQCPPPEKQVHRCRRKNENN